MATETFQPAESVGGIQRLGMGAAVLGVVGTIVGVLMYGQVRFFQAYLVAYCFVFGIVHGSMALLMIQHLSGGGWGIVIRRPLEAAVAGLGVAIAPQELVQADLDSGRLVAPWGFVETGGQWALCSVRGNSDPRIARLADWLRRQLAA